MENNFKTLCLTVAPSGSENYVRDTILKEISPFAECRVDNSGNIIAFKKGKKRSASKLMVDAHMDEVGVIVSSITDDGFLKFQTVGGIKNAVLLCRKIKFENGLIGVIGTKPVHLLSKDTAETIPDTDDLYIDIGATDSNDAKQHIKIGAYGVMLGDFAKSDKNLVCSKAIDDRAGCAILIDLLKNESEYDFYATFTVGEEIGTRGAKTAAYSVDPDFAIVLEATTAADIDSVSREKQVCKLSSGPVVSFMDNGTMYDRELFDAALSSDIPSQKKCGVSGGNNSASIHISRSGVRTLALSVPCRYIHSAACVCNYEDIENTLKLTRYMINKICSGEIN